MLINRKVAGLALMLCMALATGCRKPIMGGARGGSVEPPIAPPPGAQTQPATPGQGAGNAADAAAARVTSALKTASPPLSWQTIQVQAEGGMVHLMGTVPTPQQKSEAERTARKAAGPGVQVMNMLKVGQSPTKP